MTIGRRLLSSILKLTQATRKVPVFDPDAAALDYRQVISWRDAESDLIRRVEFQRLADVMRSQWVEWNGDDDLHETAFGG